MKRVIIIFTLLITIVILLHSLNQEKDNYKNNYNDNITIKGEGCLVLNYHRIRSSGLLKTMDKWTMFYKKDPEVLLYSVYEDGFKKQIRYLKSKGFHFITPEELNKCMKGGNDFPEKSVLITFDDADKSIYYNAYPFLLEEEIPFTIFIITGEVGNEDFKGLSLATWEQISNMKKSGLVTIGTHSHQMHLLSKKGNPPFLDKKNLERFEIDTRLSIETFEEKLGFTPDYYAYPYGFGIEETDRILLNSGYSLIFTLRPGLVKKDDSTYLLNRVLVSEGTWPKVVEWIEQKEKRMTK